ncbi:MAG: type I-G CRISPR-associated helicase/endonuclease Cas3g [Brooklawnia sp.]|jgi:CRISPR-associated endonuclease/helicase Cas3
MELTREHFADFFAAVNSDHVPFAWQERLVDFLFSNGKWPKALVAPTGTGKSAVVDIHVFMTALSAAGNGPRLPRRLAAVVGRRALVDSQAERAKQIQRYLEHPPDELAATMQHLLLSLSAGVQNARPLVLGHLRGGLAPDRGWIDEPTACAVICATPDMWGSRLLMRGYGSSRKARPREAGLLAYDSVVVLDEAHLTRQLAATAHRVSELESDHANAIGVPGLQVVETTATLPQAVADCVVGVAQGDLQGVEANSLLVDRLTRPKPVRYVESEGWASRDASYIADLAEQARALDEVAPQGTIACVVNRVRTAIHLADELGPDTPCWVGRMRPLDLDELQTDFAHLLGHATEPDAHTPRFLVATQTIEVGVDADFAGMLTEVAPGDALAQRAGRVNRRGLRDNGPIVVVGPPSAVLERATNGRKDRAVTAGALPYHPADLSNAHAWLAALAPAAGMTPWVTTESPPPAQIAERMLPKLPQPYDVHRWVSTSDPSWADEALELWIRDSLEPDDLVAGVVLRAGLPEDDGDAISLLSATPPDDREVFPAALHLVRNHVRQILSEKRFARAFLYRDSSVTFVPIDPNEATQVIMPGDVVILDANHSVTNRGVVVDANLASSTAPQCVWGEAGVEVIVPQSGDARWLTDLVGLEPEDAQLLFSASGRSEQITLPPPDPDQIRLPWLVVRPPGVAGAEAGPIQEWTRNPNPVLLADHQRAVSERAEQFAAGLGVAEQFAFALALAASHHDDGKMDRRFQFERLDNPDSRPLAKSRLLSTQEVRRRRWRGLLPPGYRHELASVVHAWRELEDAPMGHLALRLVGTSHGYARGLPPNGAEELFPEDDDVLQDLAKAIFQRGKWNSLLDETDREFGSWGCCYLESLLRAADCQVSREGS